MATRIGLGTILTTLLIGVLAVAPCAAEQTAPGANTQAASSAPATNTHEEGHVAPAGTAVPAANMPVAANGTQTAATPVLLPQEAKKRPLEVETDRLVAMATELKARVDKTNKNILSLTVVEEAEQIEHYAHQLKVGDKK